MADDSPNSQPFFLLFLKSSFVHASIVVCIVAVFFTSMMLHTLKRFDWNYSAFLHLKNRFLERNPIVNEMEDLKGTLLTFPKGHDSAFYFSVTFDPFLSKFKDKPEKYRLMVDSPRVRFARIGYPLLVKMLSFDTPIYYAQTMVLLILASHIVAAIFLVKILMFYKCNVYWGLSYVLVPGLTLSFVRALPEPVAAAAMLVGLYYYLKQSDRIAIPFLAMAVLIRETAIVLVLVMVVYEIFVTRVPRRAFTLLLSIVPYGVWRLFLTYRLFPVYGWDTLFYTPQVLTFPFYGIFELYKQLLDGAYPEGRTTAAYIFPIILSIVSMFSLLAFIKRKTVLTGALLIYSLISLCLGYDKIWIGLGNAERTTFEMFLLSSLALCCMDNKKDFALRVFVLLIMVMTFTYDYYFFLMKGSFKAGLFLKGFL